MVLLQLEIHFLDLSPQISDLAFSRLDLPLQFLNFIVKHELELLELLVLLLQVEDALFFVGYGLVALPVFIYIYVIRMYMYKRRRREAA